MTLALRRAANAANEVRDDVIAGWVAVGSDPTLATQHQQPARVTWQLDDLAAQQAVEVSGVHRHEVRR